MATQNAEDVQERSLDERLGSWKAIAAYLKRDVTTVQRWERREGMPVHRHLHDKRGSVYAYRTELDAWFEDRRRKTEVDALSASPRLSKAWVTIASAGVAIVGVTIWWLIRPTDGTDNPLARARISPLTDFDGSELAATISRDGKFVAFLSDRDGTMDAWVTQVGTGEFRNLTKGTPSELLNPEVRSLAFTPDGSLLTMWTRRKDIEPNVNVSAIPIIGGALRDYQSGAVEFDWSHDGKRAIFHTPAPGDPTFVVESSEGANSQILPKQIFIAPKGGHNHFQTWSPDDQHIYMVRGVPPDETDIWRITPEGAELERMTFHNSRVLYPTFIDRRTLLYLATSEDSSGPWLYSLDVETRRSRRISFGVEQYTSLAASADRSRLVATVEHSKPSLWRVPIRDSIAGEPDAIRVSVPTVGAFSPRLVAGGMLYVALKNDGHSIWKFSNGTANELWSAPETRIVGGPVLSPDGQTVAFCAERAGKTRLYLLDSQRASARVLAEAFDIRGAPAWSSDGKSIIVATIQSGEPQLHRVPIDGQAPTVFVRSYSINPLLSPDGSYLIYAEAGAGPDFTLQAVTVQGAPHTLPEIKLPRGARRVSFVPGRNALIVLQGQTRHNNFWYIDLISGERRQLTNFTREFTLRDFDVSPDGNEILFDRRQDNSDLALIELPRK